MIWKLIRKIARFYSLIALFVLGLLLASDQIIPRQPNPGEALLSLFFPYGVLAGLAISWIYMRLGGWITLLSTAVFYALSFWQSNIWPQNHLPLLLAGAAPLFLLAAGLKSISRKSHR